MGKELAREALRQDIVLTEVLHENGCRLMAEETGRLITDAIKDHDVVAFGLDLSSPLWIARYITEEEWIG